MRLRRWRLGAGLLILVCLLTVLTIRVATSGVASVTAGVLEQVVRVAPQSPDAYFAHGQAYCDVNDLPHANNPKHEQAQQQLNRLAAANAATYMDSAMSHFRSGDFESAIQASENFFSTSFTVNEYFLIVDISLSVAILSALIW